MKRQLASWPTVAVLFEFLAVTALTAAESLTRSPEGPARPTKPCDVDPLLGDIDRLTAAQS